METSIRATKLTKKLERGLSKTLGFFESLNPHNWERQISDESEAWTLRELVAHFIYSEEYQLRIAQDIASGGVGAPQNINLDEFNKSQIKRFQSIPTDDLLELLMDKRKETIRWVRDLDNLTLDMTGQHPTLGASNVETVVFSIYAHQLLHMREAVSKIKGD